jgi:hypothetical protein
LNKLEKLSQKEVKKMTGDGKSDKLDKAQKEVDAALQTWEPEATLFFNVLFYNPEMRGYGQTAC